MNCHFFFVVKALFIMGLFETQMLCAQSNSSKNVEVLEVVTVVDDNPAEIAEAAAIQEESQVFTNKPMTKPKNGVKGLNDYAKTHKLKAGSNRAETTFGYIPWKDGSWTDLNGNQIPASTLYENIEPIGSGLFLVDESSVVDESGKKLFSGSDISAKVYLNLLLLENSWSNYSMYGLITTDGKEIVPFGTMTKEQLNEKIRKYIEENPNDDLNFNLQLYLKYSNSAMIRLGGNNYLYSFDEFAIVDMATGQNVMENLNKEEILQKIKNLSGLFKDLQVSEDIKKHFDRYLRELWIDTWGDGLFFIGEALIVDSTGKVSPFRKDDLFRDGKKRPNEYRLKSIVPCGSKIWYRCFNSTHQAIFDYQDKIVCSWPEERGPEYVTTLTDKLFCIQYDNGKAVFYTENFSSVSTTPLSGDSLGWNGTPIASFGIQLSNLVKK